MDEYLGEIITALIGVVGTLLAAGIGLFYNYSREQKKYLRERREEERRLYERVVQPYLTQMQDAMESLSRRLENINNRGGRAVMDSGYFEESTIYALAIVLAFKRIFLLGGIYNLISERNKALADYLNETLEHIDLWLRRKGSQFKFYHYNRQALAEVVMERRCDRWQTTTYWEFIQNYRNKSSFDDPILKPAKDFIGSFHAKDQDTEKTIQVLNRTVDRLGRETSIEVSSLDPN